MDDTIQHVMMHGACLGKGRCLLPGCGSLRRNEVGRQVAVDGGGLGMNDMLDALGCAVWTCSACS